MTSLEILDYGVIVLMVIISAGIGVYFRFTGQRQKTTEEYIMGGRTMSIWPVACSIMASYLSTNIILGLPVEVYMFGTQYFACFIGHILGIIACIYLYLPVYFEINSPSIFEHLKRRFGKTTRAIVSGIFMLQMVVLTATSLYAPSVSLSAVTGLSFWTSMIVMSAVSTFYCSLGGLKAVLWTDLFQSILMFTTMLALMIKVAINIGGFGEVWNIADSGGRIIFNEVSLDPTVRYTFWNSIISSFVIVQNTNGVNQITVQRLLSTGSLKKAQRSLVLGSVLTMSFVGICFWNGLSLFAMFEDCDPLLDKESTHLSSPDQMVPYSILNLFNSIPGISGLCISGIFAAALSSVSSAVNSMTVVTIEDYIKPYCSNKKKGEDWIAAKIIALAYGILCFIVTVFVSNFRGIVEATYILSSLFASPVLGVYLLGLFTETANQQGTLFGLAGGLALNAWIAFGMYFAKAKVPILPRSTDGCEMSPIWHNGTVQNSQFSSLRYPNMTAEHERYIFPLYKISYLWLSVTGVITSVILGYIASLIIRHFVGPKPVDKCLLSPPIRKYFSSSENERRQTKTDTQDNSHELRTITPNSITME